MQWTKSQRNIEKNRVVKPERVKVADQYGEEDPCELPKLGTCKQPAIPKEKHGYRERSQNVTQTDGDSSVRLRKHCRQWALIRVSN